MTKPLYAIKCDELFWRPSGWINDQRKAKRMNEHECRQVMARMVKDGKRPRRVKVS